MAKIKTIRIKRFKRLESIEIDLGAATLLIGANNAGKSSVLQAIQFAVSLAQSAKLIGGVNWAADKYELSFAQTQLLYCPISDAMALASGGELVEDSAQRIEVGFELDDGTRSLVTLRKGRNRNLKVAIEGQALGTALQDLSNPFSIYAPGLAGVARHEAFMSLGMVRRTVARGDANLALRNVLLQLSMDTEKWDVFLSDMRSIFPDIEMQVAFNSEQDEFINAKVALDGGPMVPLDAAGTSILQASQILSYVTLFEPSLLVLDEPDSHLHPDRQRALCRLLFEVAELRGFQVIMSSHSRHVFDAAKKDATVVWLNRGQKVDGADIDTTRMLLELGALDSVDYFADGEIRCLVATEDTHTQYLEQMLNASGFRADELEIISYAGCSQTEAAIVLGSFLAAKAPNVKLLVHRDRDYLDDDSVTEFKTRLTNKGLYSFVAEPNDIESYYVNAEHIAALNPRVTILRVQELIDQATRETREASIQAIVNLRTHQAFKLRNRGGAQVNHGTIATTAVANFDDDPARYRRGDIVLGRVTALLQQELGHNPVIVGVTTHIDIRELRDVKEEVWP